MTGTFESRDTNSIWSWGDAMTNIFVVGALRESHLGALHKGATYQGSGMPDTRRDLFSLSTTRSVPLRAATVRENINSILAPRAGDCEYSDCDSTSPVSTFHANLHYLLLFAIPVIRFISLCSLWCIKIVLGGTRVQKSFWRGIALYISRKNYNF